MSHTDSITWTWVRMGQLTEEHRGQFARIGCMDEKGDTWTLVPRYILWGYDEVDFTLNPEFEAELSARGW